MPFCGGALHRADYERKPRGGPPDLSEAFDKRFSLCCEREGCRRRVLPASVRFWGRRVYWAPVVLLLTALRQGRNPDATLEKLKGICGVWRTTIKRWQRYFKELFPLSVNWRRLSGRLMPPVAVDDLPRALLARFYRACGRAETAMVQCLQVFALGP